MAAARSKRRFWLFKTEPEAFSIQDLAQAPQQTTFWDGVRNFQARNFLRDDVQLGDGVLLYHSSQEPLAIMGSCTVVKTGYPDHTAFDKSSCHFDPKSQPDQPTWYMVDIQLVHPFRTPVPRDQLKGIPDLAEMVLMQKGSRLSIQPVTEKEWKVIHKLAGLRG